MMVALGVNRRQLVLLGTARNFVVGLAGALGAVAIAVILSPIAPLGEARIAESSTGIAFDGLVLTIGVFATLVVVSVLGVWPSVRAARNTQPDQQRAPGSTSSLASYLWSIGMPPSVVIGFRNTLERGRVRSSVPVGSALLGTVLAVTALCGAAVFGASLSNLTTTPKLYGDAFQLNISNPSSGGTPDPALIHDLEHNRAVTGITKGIALPAISIGRVVVGAIAGTAVEARSCSRRSTGTPPLPADRSASVQPRCVRSVPCRFRRQVTISLASGVKRTEPFRVVAQMSLPGTRQCRESGQRSCVHAGGV